MSLVLYWGSASPFVRKVMVVAREVGMAQAIEIRDSAAHPVARDERIKAFNPLAKVPAARSTDGTLLYDSRVICEYLDTTAGGALFPPPGPARWTALRRQALADGLLDAALLIRYEALVRPERYRWREWSDKQQEKVFDALDTMAADVPADGCHDIGAIAYACALGWLSFRFPDLGWARDKMALRAWYEHFETRPAMRETRPTA